MPQHDDIVRLRHMLEYGREALDLIKGRQRADIIEQDLPPLIAALEEIVEGK